MLTRERLKELLDYNKETGIFTRRFETKNYKIGSEIGWTDRHGHKYVNVDGVDYRASRLAALYITGSLPSKALNHKDRNNSNDAWDNLTEEKLSLTHDRLIDVLRYDPETGEFTWIVGGRGHRGKSIGDKAGCVHPTLGYVLIGVDGRRYYGHRLAWFYMTGEWPKDEIDHIDGVESNNAWINLREANRPQNAANCKIKSSSKVGLKGVTHDKRDGFYYPKLNGKSLGRYQTKEEAHKAYCDAGREKYGEFFNEG